jgi:hypothetical protein
LDIHYFAYGSNLCLPRLRSRAPGVQACGAATLHGFGLRWHKRSSDGSGKCSIIQSEASSALVHGALYVMSRSAKELLDQVEGLGNGYEETTVNVMSAEGSITARTYVAAASHVDDSLRPYSWYRDLVVSGALAHQLPVEYVSSLQGVGVWADPNQARAQSHLASMPCRGPA